MTTENTDPIVFNINPDGSFEGNHPYADNPTLSVFKTVPALAKSYDEARRKMGSMTSIPTESSGDDDWNNFYSKIRPESPDKYSIKANGEVWNEESVKDLKSLQPVFHKLGLSNRQAQGIVSEIIEPFIKQGVESDSASESDYIESSQGELSKEFDIKELVHKRSALLSHLGVKFDKNNDKDRIAFANPNVNRIIMAFHEAMVGSGTKTFSTGGNVSKEGLARLEEKMIEAISSGNSVETTRIAGEILAYKQKHKV